MRKLLLLIISCLPAATLLAQQKITPGMRISRSATISKSVYKIDYKENKQGAVILVEGDNLVIDFKGAELKGSNMARWPDEFAGTGLLIQNSRKVTIRNLKVSGYKIALLARNVSQLVLENCDFSYNYRPRLKSDQLKEDIADWMSYHQNEKDEWMRYGAAVYLADCDSAVVRDCTVTGGQNALMMTRCNDAVIYNNDFSFNSGIGIGMYRSSGNKIFHNRLIFNVRGYSHGIYNRGQDSAGILVYEQSSHNLFYKNNVTHGGDGFFLWAGQTTMDSGQGGCNDNLLIRNDFSYAPTNGIEVTFSRNIIYGNRIFECDHGIWGGYSYQTFITDNQFRNNRIGIAIEHGQQNSIAYNLFSKDKEAIRLWARREQPADWGYARKRDTRSRGYTIVSNSFNQVPVIYNLSRTDSIAVFENAYTDSSLVYQMDSTVTGIDSTINRQADDSLSKEPEILLPAVKGLKDPFKGAGPLAGRKNIRMTEWGPYDFRYPLIWRTNPADTSGLLTFDIPGPAGKWRVKHIKGVERLSAQSGSVPGSLTAQRLAGDITDIEIELEYTGGAVTSVFGQKTAKGRPFVFGYRQFFQPVSWDVAWYALDTLAHNPLQTGQLFAPHVRMAPIKKEAVKEIRYAWWGGIKADRQYPQFITLANGTASVAPGEYELAVTWDDAVRVYVDGKIVLDEWNPSKYRFDESPHRRVKLQLGGNHHFMVEHLELGGFATLSVRLHRAP